MNYVNEPWKDTGDYESPNSWETVAKKQMAYKQNWMLMAIMEFAVIFMFCIVYALS